MTVGVTALALVAVILLVLAAHLQPRVAPQLRYEIISRRRSRAVGFALVTMLFLVPRVLVFWPAITLWWVNR